MNILDIFAVIVLVLSFLGGLKQGAAKELISLVAFIVSIPLAGILYGVAAAIISFLPGDNWQNFIGFFVTLGIMNALLGLMFFLPRMVFQALWGKGGYRADDHNAVDAHWLADYARKVVLPEMGIDE